MVDDTFPNAAEDTGKDDERKITCSMVALSSSSADPRDDLLDLCDDNSGGGSLNHETMRLSHHDRCGQVGIKIERRQLRVSQGTVKDHARELNMFHNDVSYDLALLTGYISCCRTRARSNLSSSSRSAPLTLDCSYSPDWHNANQSHAHVRRCCPQARSL